MNTPGDGGSAFPGYTLNESADGETVEITKLQPGMSLRDYFAALAPVVPDWFKDEPPDVRSFVLPPEFLRDKEKFDQWCGWHDYLDDEQIKPEWLAEFRQIAQIREEHRKFEAAKLAEFYLTRETSWRYRFARAMLAERTRPVRECVLCSALMGDEEGHAHKRCMDIENHGEDMQRPEGGGR